ncbi:hypothetical protein Gasu2_57410 [Galdieria sulphuraria]|uniref:High light inducible protein n=1 Tax=Galdieria sulphuraria TaxID=130081 RepID=M2W373_GALSU|nr:uncharacterized protein Gasu_25280 [Galdieria sulphuraria]EME30151.1 hypothetical protein Gasu_25280 [Galdieria sulphuraria]GJD11611.1 hypothetical protein Gasu2_57410 [Galdieria sulphuraria]|eukprot:XP_005706671.1 hypothetical protein Gasu_25280 [Galdieria sulphuraria]
MVAFITGSYLVQSPSIFRRSTTTRLAFRHSIPQARSMKNSKYISMKTETTEQKESPYKKLEENVQAKKNAEYRGPQGFTPYAETVNGRLAMIGFFSMIVAELFNPSHPSLLKQMEIIFPFDKLPFIGNILG